MSHPPKDPEAEDGFLSRWSRRKRSDLPEEAALAPEAGAEAEAAVAPEDERTDAEILEDLGLPDPEDLKEGDDFSGFMNGAVPTRLRNRALRKLWLSNPLLANLDGMVDYGEDFTDAATVVENLQTAYQVGKGWLRDKLEEDPDAAEAEVAQETPEPVPSDEKPEETEVEPVAALTEPADPPMPESAPEPVAADPPTDAPAVPRRMRFRFDSA